MQVLALVASVQAQILKLAREAIEPEAVSTAKFGSGNGVPDWTRTSPRSWETVLEVSSVTICKRYSQHVRLAPARLAGRNSRRCKTACRLNGVLFRAISARGRTIPTTETDSTGRRRFGRFAELKNASSERRRRARRRGRRKRGGMIWLCPACLSTSSTISRSFAHNRPETFLKALRTTFTKKSVNRQS